MATALHQETDSAESKTAPRIFFAASPHARPVLPTQVTETHLESVTYVYRNAPGCVVAPNSGGAIGGASGGSGLGNALRNIPLVGRVLGGAGDIVSGVVGTAAGIVTLGHSGTLGSGLNNIGHGLGGVAMGGLDLVGKAWNAPNTAVGLVWGGVGVLMGANVTIGNNAIQFENHPLMFGAITLGNTISYAKDFGPSARIPEGTVGDHERQHTYQGQVLGPLYLLSNGLGLGAGRLFNGDTHGPANWNEVGPQSTPPRPWP